MKQKPLDGTSLVYTFDKAAPTRHTTQYFEITGNRAIYKDGWIASTTPLRLPWVTIGAEPNPDDFKWELYNTFDVREDTGTPVLEEYDSKMPYRFTGTLNQVCRRSPSAQTQCGRAACTTNWRRRRWRFSDCRA